jgi:hypothetical protein
MADILGAEVDEEGFLVDLKDWTKEIAVEMAKGDDIDLSATSPCNANTLPCAAKSASMGDFVFFAAEITPSSMSKITLLSSIVFKQDCNELRSKDDLFTVCNILNSS